MKKHLLLLGTLAVSAFVMTSCSDDDDNGGGETPEYIWLVDKIEGQDENKVSYAFAYNADHTLASVTTYDDGMESSRDTYTFSGGKLTEVKAGSKELSITYSGSAVSVTDANSASPVPTVYTLDNNGRVTQGLIETTSPFDDEIKVENEYEYDSKGRMVKMSTSTYVNDELQPPGFMDATSFEYKYDDKNPLVYEGMLPSWYLTVENLLNSIIIRPAGNVVEFKTVGGMFAGANLYKAEYNEDGYPVKYSSLDDQGNIRENSTFSIIYKKIEVTK